MKNTQQAKFIKWRAVFAESAVIGASIILGFALQDWDEERDIQDRTQIALCNVKSELSLNRILLQKDVIPRQNGLLASVKGNVALLQNQSLPSISQTHLEKILLLEPLRYSAWRLAGESGYLLHANFELATEIGALIDFQKDTYQPVVNRIHDAIFDRRSEFIDNPLSYYQFLSGITSEWVAQTQFLEQRYTMLFERSDFRALPCGGDAEART